MASRITARLTPNSSASTRPGGSLVPAGQVPAAVRLRAQGLFGRGQTLAQMALAWVLREGGITSALIGASKPEQVEDCAGAIRNLDFTAEELGQIGAIAEEKEINLWAKSADL